MEIDTGDRKIDAANAYIKNVRSTINRVNDWIRNISDDLCIPMVDLAPHFQGEDPDRLRDDLGIGDNAHLNVDGQVLVARLLYEGYFKEAEGVSTIVCLGDSHTQGFPMNPQPFDKGIPADPGSGSRNHFPLFLSELTGATVHNRGIAGNTVYGMLNRFGTEVLPLLPDHCVILGGTNDALIGTPLEDTIEDLEKLYRRCIDAGIVPVACTIIPLGI